MSDKELLEKYIDLEKSCLPELEKKEVLDMLYTYKDTFSLRDETDTSPNVEVEIDVTDKLPFLLDHIIVKKRIKIYWKRNEKVVLPQYLKKCFFQHIEVQLC